jgi:hypothetical protein
VFGAYVGRIRTENPGSPNPGPFFQVNYAATIARAFTSWQANELLAHTLPVFRLLINEDLQLQGRGSAKLGISNSPPVWGLNLTIQILKSAKTKSSASKDKDGGDNQKED